MPVEALLGLIEAISWKWSPSEISIVRLFNEIPSGTIGLLSCIPFTITLLSSWIMLLPHGIEANNLVVPFATPQIVIAFLLTTAIAISLMFRSGIIVLLSIVNGILISSLCSIISLSKE